VAGTQFRGQFESRMKGLIEEIRKLGNVILVIDEVHNIVGAGDAEGSMNAANILKPALSRGEIQVIGATTFNEYRKYIEKDTALERRFQPVTVAEPSIEDTLKILKGIAHYYETYHGVSIPEGVLRQAVLLSERYITDRFLPDKAIDLIDEACSDLNLKDPTINRRMEVKRDLENVTFERETLMSAEAPEGEEVTEEQLDQRYARIAELRSQEMRLQEELTELEKKGVPQVTMENIARDVDQDPRQQDQGRGVQASGGAGYAAEATYRGTGRGRGRRVGGHPAQPGRHLPQAQAGELHFRGQYRRGQDGAGEAAGRRSVRFTGFSDPAGYVGVYGEALRVSAGGFASGLCGL